MEFEYCSHPLSDLLGLLIFGYVLGPFVVLFVLFPLKALLTFISFVFDRFTSERQGAFEACEYVLKNLANRYGGAFYKFNSYRLVCLLPKRNLFVEVEKDVLVRIRIHKEWDEKRITWKKWLRCGEVTHDRMIGWIKSAELLPVRQKSLQMTPLDNNQRCAFCREWLETERGSIRCFNCSAPYHLICFETNSGCAVFGCGDQQPVPATDCGKSIHDIVKSHNGPDRMR